MEQFRDLTSKLFVNVCFQIDRRYYKHLVNFNFVYDPVYCETLQSRSYQRVRDVSRFGIFL